MEQSPTISVIIPTLNASRTIYALLRALKSQKPAPTEIWVVDSASDDETLQIARSVEGVSTVRIAREDFDHGGTRHSALMLTSGSIVCFVNQDAMPVDDTLLASLIEPLADPRIAASYARQLPTPGLRRSAALVQEYNYPPLSYVHACAADSPPDLENCFFSDVCSAYRREDYMQMGGFERPIATNEDMLMCARLLRAGKSVAYVAKARVCHSNTLTLRQQFARDKAIGSFLSTYSDELGGGGEMGRGAALTKHVASALLREHQVAELAYFGAYCAVRLAGNRIGRACAKGAKGGNSNGGAS